MANQRSRIKGRTEGSSRSSPTRKRSQDLKQLDVERGEEIERMLDLEDKVRQNFSHGSFFFPLHSHQKSVYVQGLIAKSPWPLHLERWACVPLWSSRIRMCPTKNVYPYQSLVPIHNECLYVYRDHRTKMFYVINNCTLGY